MFRMLSKFGVNVLWPHRVVRPAVSWGHRSPNIKVKQALSRVHSPHRRFCCKLRVRKSLGIELRVSELLLGTEGTWKSHELVSAKNGHNWYIWQCFWHLIMEPWEWRHGQIDAREKTWCQCSIFSATFWTSHLGLLHLIFHHPNRFKTLLDSILHILASYVTYMVPRQKGTVGTPWEHRGGLSETARGDRLETVLREKLHSAQLPEPDLVQYPVCPRPLGRTGDEGI